MRTDSSTLTLALTQTLTQTLKPKPKLQNANLTQTLTLTLTYSGIYSVGRRGERCAHSGRICGSGLARRGIYGSDKAGRSSSGGALCAGPEPRYDPNPHPNDAHRFPPTRPVTLTLIVPHGAGSDSTYGDSGGLNPSPSWNPKRKPNSRPICKT